VAGVRGGGDDCSGRALPSKECHIKQGGQQQLEPNLNMAGSAAAHLSALATIIATGHSSNDVRWRTLARWCCWRGRKMFRTRAQAAVGPGGVAEA
jgi:hypothetical protein